jgi:hypothetical protein
MDRAWEGGRARQTIRSAVRVRSLARAQSGSRFFVSSAQTKGLLLDAGSPPARANWWAGQPPRLRWRGIARSSESAPLILGPVRRRKRGRKHKLNKSWDRVRQATGGGKRGTLASCGRPLSGQGWRAKGNVRSWRGNHFGFPPSRLTFTW